MQIQNNNKKELVNFTDAEEDLILDYSDDLDDE